MNEILTLAVVPAVLWAVLFFLRVSGPTLILSVLVGKLFADELSLNVQELSKGILPTDDIRHVQLFLLLLPVVLTIILTRSKVSSSKLSNAVPLLFASISLILFALPYSGYSGLSETGQDIVDSYRSYILCATGGIALLFAWSPDLRLKGRRRHHR
ncbi:MAG TPA: hypothetical protein VFK11_02965 [Candidatus Saccharimonadales bacterium]|nr:hypothetical protein [Candidatus Saccharimonadales bacterium]